MSDQPESEKKADPFVYTLRHGDGQPALHLDLGAVERVEVFGMQYFSIDPDRLSPEARQKLAEVLSRLSCKFTVTTKEKCERDSSNPADF